MLTIMLLSLQEEKVKTGETRNLGKQQAGYFVNQILHKLSSTLSSIFCNKLFIL